MYSLCTNKPCCVVLQLYVYEKLSLNQSWVNLLFSALWDSILYSILDNLFSILNSCRNRESQIESRIETRNGLSTHFLNSMYCIQVKLFCCWKRTSSANFFDYSWRKHGFASIIIKFDNFYSIWKGFCVIRELTCKHSMNRKNSWNTVIVHEIYIHHDAWSMNIVAHESKFLPIKQMQVLWQPFEVNQ